MDAAEHGDITMITTQLYKRFVKLDRHVGNYAVLEEGLRPIPESVRWFKYDRERDGYFEIDMPDGKSSLTSFVLG